ncbi:glycosyltransferase family 90 protein [Trichoderma citrinoviride]|uniref:Glycosyltransferase family 90 protein n=1 Tax=Trichoderma citrinoviride TaxID=58853 RepID=A0A2T4AZY1_9HYPO|nr:glycosyltransferase family 90 protein [Trichoderma citrinoviride]PTB62620.1 glycosyltransferase family 90 protein [Trichoderma citrinoviride]
MRGAAYHPLALICLSLSTYLLSIRYYTSASFERPVHFTIVTLLFIAFALLASEYYWSRQSNLQSLTVIANHKTSADIIPPTSKTAFLPLFSFIWEAIWPRLHKKQPLWSTPSKSQIIFTFIAAAWPLFIISAEGSSNIPTGTVCPIGWRWERFVPSIQLINCLLDAAIISHTAHLARTAADDDVDISKFMGKLCLAAAGMILLLCFPSWLSDSEFSLAFRFRAVDCRDFAFDGLLATAGVLSALTLLSSLDPSCLALLLVTASFTGSRIPVLKVIPLLSPAAYVALALPLWYLAVGIHHTMDSTTSRSLFNWLIVCSSGFALLASVAVLNLIVSGYPALIPIDRALKSLMTGASTSNSLADAVKEYTRRYTIPPPPNFDKWYEFAREHNSAVIDDFDQINDDLLPFWAVDPASLREQTASLFAYASTEMGGVRIRNGSVEQSPHIPGSHRWMADSLQRMIEPFAQWLPDLDIAINLADECRMVVPHERMEAKVTSNEEQKTWPDSHFPQSPWPEDFAEPLPRGTNGGKDEIDPSFTDDIRTPIFYDFVAAACPQDSVVRNSRWWDWSTTCVNCLKPHSVPTTGGALLANVSLAHELCHQPDVAYLSGFLNSPSAMVRTSELLPIFSQARVGGFSDILIPSPWNFDEKSAFKEDSGVKWEDKENALFWRGSRSDGFSAHGRWPGFLRPRFVHEAYEETVALQRSDAESLRINVSFTGEISKCDGRDCAAESETYKKWGLATMENDSTSQEVNELPPSVPFEEHWRYRHLFDMDGAGFSGRFLPFLESRSLPYRAALFRTWYDERLQGWHHYVPVDVRLGPGFWSVLEFFMRGGADDKDGDEGPAMAKKIAEQGREWAQRALRKEDMQIYMFRLLLEWGRITHDEREHLGFTI